jgi:hypothetical protein
MDASCGIRRFARRLLVASVAAATLSLVWSSSAFAQLGSLTGPADSTLGTVTNTVSQSVAPVVQTAPTPVSQTAAPPAQTATPAVQTVSAPVAQTIAPVVQAASPVVQTVTTPVARVTAPVAETVAPVVQSVAAPVVQAATPIMQAAAPLLDSTAPLVGSLADGVLEVVPPLLAGNGQALVGIEPIAGSREPSSPPTSSSETSTSASAVSTGDTSIPVVAESPATTYAADARAGIGLWLGAGPLARSAVLRLEGRSAWSRALPMMHAPPGFTGSAGTSDADARKGARATFPSAPGPTSPNSPAGFSSIAAAFSGGGASIFVAALVAALLLAVPGLSRRLRLELAPWPLPLPLSSLERPG